MHDFAIPGLGKAVPYGIYDVSANAGFVNVGISADTGEFSVASIRRWWYEMAPRVIRMRSEPDRPEPPPPSADEINALIERIAELTDAAFLALNRDALAIQLHCKPQEVAGLRKRAQNANAKVKAAAAKAAKAQTVIVARTIAARGKKAGKPKPGKVTTISHRQGRPRKSQKSHQNQARLVVENRQIVPYQRPVSWVAQNTAHDTARIMPIRNNDTARYGRKVIAVPQGFCPYHARFLSTIRGGASAPSPRMRIASSFLKGAIRRYGTPFAPPERHQKRALMAYGNRGYRKQSRSETWPKPMHRPQFRPRAA